MVPSIMGKFVFMVLDFVVLNTCGTASESKGAECCTKYKEHLQGFDSTFHSSKTFAAIYFKQFICLVQRQ